LCEATGISANGIIKKAKELIKRKYDGN
jgi:hypothetical protein